MSAFKVLTTTNIFIFEETSSPACSSSEDQESREEQHTASLPNTSCLRKLWLRARSAGTCEIARARLNTSVEVDYHDS